MRSKIMAIILLVLLASFTQDSFRNEQLRYPRVRKAYDDKKENMLSLLKDKNLSTHSIRLYLRVFKQGKKIELWGKMLSDEKYQLIKIYNICSSSGGLGPKRRQGDRQVPEGFYNINIFNPHSNFYLSLGINYPNRSDRILSDPESPGGDIYIHGSCVTIGCLPITDPEIMELYITCVEAKNSGQQKIPVTIFPAKLEKQKFNNLLNLYKADEDKTELWSDLKMAYDFFNKNRCLPEIEFLENGRHNITAIP